jgi:outer membrane lipoprotein-sorting protein
MDAAAGRATLAAVKRCLLLFLALLPLPVLGADIGAEVARKHAERSGGRAREIQSLYAEGRTLIRDEVIEFRLWAQRPGRLRVESVSPSRRVVQVADGVHEPMISHSDVEGGRPLRMGAAERRDFLANADFDGPLVDHAAKGNSVDYAGSDLLDGRPASKLLVMSPRDDVLFLWVDEETGEIVKRSVFRVARERRVTVDTFFSDFRDVAGTRQPHRIETKVGEGTLYLMVVARMEADSPRVTPEVFALPEGWPRLAVSEPPAAPRP